MLQVYEYIDNILSFTVQRHNNA